MTRTNNASGAPTGAELTVSNTGGTSGDAFSSYTPTNGPSFQAVDDAVLGKRAYQLVGSGATVQASINWNETTPPPAASWRHVERNPVYTDTGTSVVVGQLRGTGGNMADLRYKADGSTYVHNSAGTAIISAPAGTRPTDGSKYCIEWGVDPGTDTTNGKARLVVWRWTSGAWVQQYYNEATGQNTFQSGGVTSRRWGKQSGQGVLTRVVTDIYSNDSYAAIGTPPPDVPPFVAPTGNYDIVVGLIQSNMRGAATDFDPVTDQYDSNTYMWQASTGKIIAATEPQATIEGTTGMGVSNTFLKDYQANKITAGRHLLMVNVAVGGTGFSLPSSNANAAYHWRYDLTDDANNLAWNAVRTVQAALATAGSGSKIVAFLANHGSTEGINNTPKDTFKGWLSAWITFIRGQFSGTTNTPYVMMQMRRSLIDVENRHKIIDDGQQEIAAVTPYTVHVPSPAGATYYNSGDTVHFNATGVRVLGHSMYTAFANITPPPFVQGPPGRVINGGRPVIAHHVNVRINRRR